MFRLRVPPINIYNKGNAQANALMELMEIVILDHVKIVMLLVQNVEDQQLINVENAKKDGY